MKPQPNQQQDNESDKKKVGYNETLSQKGRASVAASAVLILSSLGFVQLSQLPFIGAALKPSEGSPLTCLLSISAFYFWYRFSTYKRVAELDSKTDELSLKYAKIYLRWKARRYIKKAERYLLSNGSITGFESEGISPAENAMAGYTNGKPKWSNYHLKTWKVNDDGLFNKFRWASEEDQFVYAEFSQNDVEIEFSSSYTLIQGQLGIEDSAISSGTLYHSFKLPISNYRRLESVCKQLAKLRLPDFLETMFPTLLFTAAMLIALLCPSSAHPTPKVPIVCQEAAKSMINACS